MDSERYVVSITWFSSDPVAYHGTQMDRHGNLSVKISKTCFDQFAGVKVLLSNGANINAVYKLGRTMLIWAAYKGYLNIIEVRL